MWDVVRDGRSRIALQSLSSFSLVPRFASNFCSIRRAFRPVSRALQTLFAVGATAAGDKTSSQRGKKRLAATIDSWQHDGNDGRRAHSTGPWEYDELVGLCKLVTLGGSASSQGQGGGVDHAGSSIAVDGVLASLLVPSRTLVECQRHVAVRVCPHRPHRWRPPGPSTAASPPSSQLCLPLDCPHASWYSGLYAGLVRGVLSPRRPCLVHLTFSALPLMPAQTPEFREYHSAWQRSRLDHALQRQRIGGWARIAGIRDRGHMCGPRRTPSPLKNPKEELHGAPHTTTGTGLAIEPVLCASIIPGSPFPLPPLPRVPPSAIVGRDTRRGQRTQSRSPAQCLWRRRRNGSEARRPRRVTSTTAARPARPTRPVHGRSSGACQPMRPQGKQAPWTGTRWARVCRVARSYGGGPIHGKH